MLHIVLTILAVLGKILLALLGFILLLFLLILFVPVRYSGTVQKQDSSLQGQGSVSWLLRLIQIRAGWADRKLSYEIRIFGIPLLRLLRWIRERKSRKAQKSRKKEEAVSVKEENVSEPEENQPAAEAAEKLETAPGENQPAAEATEPLESVSEEKQVSAEQTEACPQEAAPEQEPSQGSASAAETPEARPDGEEKQEKTAEEASAEKSSRFEKIRKRFGAAVSKIKELFGKTIRTVEKLRSGAEQVTERIRKILDLLRSDLFREVFELTRKELFLILRHIFPRKIRGRLEYGTGDPASTGEILAALAACMPFLPKELVICPDFEEAVLNCDLSVKGRVRLAVPAFHGGKLLLNKQVRRLIKKVRHKEA